MCLPMMSRRLLDVKPVRTAKDFTLAIEGWQERRMSDGH
jgi:hypothetical protein